MSCTRAQHLHDLHHQGDIAQYLTVAGSCLGYAISSAGEWPHHWFTNTRKTARSSDLTCAPNFIIRPDVRLHARLHACTPRSRFQGGSTSASSVSLRRCDYDTSCVSSSALNAPRSYMAPWLFAPLTQVRRGHEFKRHKRVDAQYN